jgi:hypothetical protein
MRATATLPLRPRGPTVRLVAEETQGCGPAGCRRDEAVPGAGAGRVQRLVSAELLARAEERAVLAERRLRSRLLELTWPATAACFAGGFAAVMAVRWAGL